MLMGKYLDLKSLTEMMGELGMTDEKTLNIISNTRKGYLGKINTSETTEEEFKQSIRATFSQDNACSIAEARFRSAGDNVELAVGAIKELMLVHETRKLGWKILHPIKNYRENAMISSLTERLTTEKNFKVGDIASNMISSKDTFSMNWGEGLSYDRDALSFAKDKADAFKPSENKLLGVLEEAHRKFCEKGRVNNTAANEMTVHKAPASVDGRVKIMINNDSLTEKETEKSQRIIHEQPTTNKSKNI
jgi:hypothetical protein